MEASTPSTGKGPMANLAARRAAGEIHADPVQEKIVLRLQAIHDQLGAMASAQPAKKGLLARLGLGHAPKPPEGPHGLYIWGSVGRGKSMLMDLFFADAPVAKKRRVHFHEFMRDVHRQLDELKGVVFGRTGPRGGKHEGADHDRGHREHRGLAVRQRPMHLAEVPHHDARTPQ